MKLTFLPTLTDLREMLGDRLYVDFVWMWREQEQTVLTQERRAKWGEQVPPRNAESWPQPFFTRVEAQQPVQPGQKPAQVAVLHRLLEQRAVAKEAERLKNAEPENEAEAIASRVRAAGLRAAAE